MAKRLIFWLPFIPTASKNSRDHWKDPRGFIRSVPNERARDQWAHMGDILAAMDCPDFEDDELELAVDVDPKNKGCLVRVRSLGPIRCRSHTGRGHDTDNILVTVGDGLQRNSIIRNDSQIRRVCGERWPGGLLHG